jgi:hypothetical protein
MLVQRQRVYELIIGDSKSGDALLINNSLQVTFDISKSSSNKDKTNSAAIEITNLSNESLKLLDVDYPAAVFSAGYLEIGMKRLFAGQITNVTTRKSGTDRVTQIQMGAGYTSLNHQVLSQLTAPGRTVKDVLEDIRKAIPNVSRGVFNGTNLNNPVIYGYPLMGTPKEMLDELSSKYGLHWQVDEDVLYVHDNDRANTENFEQAYVISKYTGLIENAYRVSGDVRRGAKDKSKKQGVQLKMLLNPDIIPGDIVKLEDTLITGWFRIDSLRHTGGWRDSSWYTQLDLSALEKVENKKE